MAKIHPLATVHPNAKLGENVEVGPYAYIEEHVEIGDGTKILPHATIFNYVKMGKNLRPCLNYHIGRCPAPCAGKITKEEYDARLQAVVEFLKGHTDGVSQVLEERMQTAAENENFERAITLRERLKIIEKIREKKITSFPKDYNMDVFGFFTNGNQRAVSQLFIRQGRMQGGENFHVIDTASSVSELLGSFLVQYYENAVIPEEIAVSEETDCEILSKILSERAKRKVNVFVPKMGVRKQLCEMANANAQDFLDKSMDTIKLKENMTVGAVALLKEYLSLPTLPRRIECYDISNISGTDKTASMTVAIDGTCERKLYRRFRIKTVEGANDFASMAEVIGRRLTRLLDENETDASFSARPSLIVIDGGKGQLGYAQDVMKGLGLDIPMIGLAKREEEIFLPTREDPIVLPKNNNALKLIQRIRDESHRFAITYHRTLRTKTALHSLLDELSGVGEKRKAALVAHFRTLNRVKEASVSELEKVEGIGKSLAESIYEQLHNGEERK